MSTILETIRKQPGHVWVLLDTPESGNAFFRTENSI